MSSESKPAAEDKKELALRRLLLRPQRLFILRYDRRWFLLDEGVACWPLPSWWERPTFVTDKVIPVKLRNNAQPKPRVEDAAVVQKCERVWMDAINALKVTTPLKAVGEVWEEGDIEAERFVRTEDETPVLIQLHFAKALRALARKAEQPRLVQVAGKGISFFDPIHQPVALLDGKRMQAMVMPVKE